MPTEERPVELRPPAPVFVYHEYSCPSQIGATTTTGVRRPKLLSLNHARRRVEQIIHLPANMHTNTVHTRIQILSTAPNMSKP
jgi:hypothetical protein